VTVNVNRLKRCHNPPTRKQVKKGTILIPEKVQSGDEWSKSDDEQLHLLGQPKLIPSSQD